ncbi:MAG TPA: tyrosine-type recombinase/integrase [Sedimentisphaerales bacterium]|nr:tyrosine-type recombinase/integrase [Sedimentisphaerales bacterium]
MNLYRPKFKDRKTGMFRETPRWYIDFRDHHGTRQRFAGDADEHATAEFGRMLDDLVRCRKRKVLPTDCLWNWLQGLPIDVQAKLIKLDLAEPEWLSGFCPFDRLSDWIEEFEQWLDKSRAKSGFRRNAVHIGTTMSRVRAVVEGCDFKTWGDITKSKVETYLGTLSVKPGTYNGYIAAFKPFCTWVVRDGRAEFSPVQYLERVTVPQKEKRRPLAANEVSRLLQVTANAWERYGLTGMERAVLYRLGIETGFRRNELAHLTADCFDLKKAVVRLSAEFCKDRRDATQPITMALASRLASFLSDREPTNAVFVLRTPKTARMIQADATEVGLPLMDDKGRELVFHSLRHTLRTELVRARVAEAVTDHIMRHKPTGVGRRFYTHLTEFEIREAIERLPEYPWPAECEHQHTKKAVS